VCSTPDPNRPIKRLDCAVLSHSEHPGPDPVQTVKPRVGRQNTACEKSQAVAHEVPSASRHCRSLFLPHPEDFQAGLVSQNATWAFGGWKAIRHEEPTRLGRAPVLAVIGNSGSGKSSLIQAGLIPALQRGHFRLGGKSVDGYLSVIKRPKLHDKSRP
jgi:hypothetical protein